eukprot:5068595-Amphidinium_carterae.1
MMNGDDDADADDDDDGDDDDDDDGEDNGDNDNGDYFHDENGFHTIPRATNQEKQMMQVSNPLFSIWNEVNISISISIIIRHREVPDMRCWLRAVVRGDACQCPYDSRNYGAYWHVSH